MVEPEGVQFDHLPGFMSLSAIVLAAGMLVLVIFAGVFQAANFQPGTQNISDRFSQSVEQPTNRAAPESGVARLFNSQGRASSGLYNQSAALEASSTISVCLPLVFNRYRSNDPANLVTQKTFSLPHPLAYTNSSWCTWGWCSISPRLYHEPGGDGKTLVGWTDSSGDGHVSRITSGGTLEITFDFPVLSVRGLVVHDTGQFAVLLWDANAKIMWLSKREANGSETWKANIDGSLTSFNPGVGDSRLTYGNGLYMAYFAVHGDSGWVEGHEGDQLSFVNDAGSVQSGGWEWGCSHSMAELASYHPSLSKFMPVCSSDCYSSKGILLNDSQSVYASDGNCGGNVSAQLGQATLSENSWKLVFNALNRPGYTGKGIGLATINGLFQSSFVWLTNTNGDYERDPVLARLGSDLSSDRYLVGWTTTNTGEYLLGVINGSGIFSLGPLEVTSAGINWGNRDDSFRTRADGDVSWVQGDPGSTTLNWFVFDADGSP